jgi:hypothetical protein
MASTNTYVCMYVCVCLLLSEYSDGVWEDTVCMCMCVCRYSRQLLVNIVRTLLLSYLLLILFIVKTNNENTIFFLIFLFLPEVGIDTETYPLQAKKINYYYYNRVKKNIYQTI